MKITKPYFFYDPDNGIEFFATQDEALAAAQESIESRQADLDGAWPDREEMERLYVGCVTHAGQETNVRRRPPDSELDHDYYDADGYYWGSDGPDYYCDYVMHPLHGRCAQSQE